MKRITSLAAAALTCGVIMGAVANPSSAEMRLRVAGQHAVEHPATKALERIAEKIEAADVGLSAKVFPANQLGDYTLVIEDLIKGAVDLAHISVGSQLNPKLEAAFFPFLVSSYEEMKRIYSPGSCFYGAYGDMLDALGVKLLGIVPEGFIGIGLTKPGENLMTAGADKNLLIRVPPLETFNLGVEAMGFRTTSIAYADLYPALQTGVADGWIGGTAALNYTGFSDVVKEFVPYNAYVEATAYLASEATWDKLDDKQRALIEAAFSEEAEAAVRRSESEDKTYLTKLGEKGIKVVDFSGPKAEAFVAQVRQEVWPRLEEKFGADLISCLKSDLE